MSTPSPAPDLRDACIAWQGGRDGGSSPIRAAARVLTATKHYFQADFIDRLERKAATDHRTMQRASVLLAALNVAPQMDAEGWGRSVGYRSGWVGRGIESAAQDDQIRSSLATGALSMPLWGLSLDRDVARSFGTGFQFELLGPFPAIAVWAESEIKSDERELIAGGIYSVENVEETPTGTTIVQLQFTGSCDRLATHSERI